MPSTLERLEAFMDARHQSLTGHELARAAGLPAALLMDELHGVRLLTDVCLERGATARDVSRLFMLDPSYGSDRVDLYVALSEALQHHCLDNLVAKLDREFEFGRELEATLSP